MKYYILLMSIDYADEFDVPIFSVFDEVQCKYILKFLESLKFDFEIEYAYDSILSFNLKNLANKIKGSLEVTKDEFSILSAYRKEDPSAIDIISEIEHYILNEDS